MNTIPSDGSTPAHDAADAGRTAAAIGLRIKQARGPLSQKQLAGMVGVHANTIYKLEKGYPPDALQILEISKATNVSPCWLLLGDEAGAGPEPASVVPRSLEAVEMNGYLYVPHFNVQASAGDGFFNDIEQVTTMRPFELQFIRSRLGITHNTLAMINIVGRSYEPVLHAGDAALVDRRDREALEGPHVIRLDGALLVKQLQRLPGRVLRVSSKNTEYEAFDISPSEDAQRDFEVIGRLRWAGVVL
ncbi:S24 family peptidase [Pseudacidovorax intermedius]|uniref:S24 family peptidase n=1 Tax=Pseudacidovorax intermedius TaxID=433924 RepID=UPI0026EC4470|nr:S24 family peptidase [Pseudacidovorax intermedius]